MAGSLEGKLSQSYGELLKPCKVLIVEDDPDFRRTMVLILRAYGYDVLEAQNGREALCKFSEANPNLVISDINLPEMNGVELFKEIKKVKETTPVVLMTGFSELMNVSDAYTLGVTEFISKPFDKEDLLSCLQLVQHTWTQGLSGETGINIDSDYCRIHIDDFLSGSQLQSDIFLRLSSTKYLKVAKKGSSVSPQRLESYKSKGLDYLYIKKEEFSTYLGFNLSISKVASDKGAKISRHKKMKLLKHAIEVCLQDAYVNGLSKDKFFAAKGLVESTLNVMVDNGDIFSMLNMLKEHQDKIYSHSMGVSLYAIAIAQQMGWTSASTQFKIAMAGLLHDIGKKEIPVDILDKPRILLKAEEVMLLESHTIRGQALLAQIPGVPEEVAMVAAQHHENLMGLGYPYRLPRQRIHPLARLISVADDFCNLTLSAINPVSALEAIDHIWNLKKNDLDPHGIKALMLLWKVPLPKELQNLQMMKATG